MDIRAALKLPKRKGVFSPSRKGLSAAQIIFEMDRWYMGLPQDPAMDWQVRSYRMSPVGIGPSGPWCCLDCHGEAIHEPTYFGNYYIHKCPNWKPRYNPPLDRERSYNEQVDDGLDEWIKRHDSRSGGFGGL